jgi:hypothetical protein
LIDDTRFWVTHDPAYVVNAFLTHHPGRGLEVSATGDYSGPSQDGSDVVDTPRGSVNGTTELEFTFTEPRLNIVLLRADALIVPSGARCESMAG